MRKGRNECKECYRVWQRDARREYRKEYYRKNRERQLEECRKNRITEEGKERHRLAQARDRERFPEKHRARVATKVLKRGECSYPDCSHEESRIEAHHWDYSKPLDVVWLCKRHHVLADNIQKLLTK